MKKSFIIFLHMYVFSCIIHGIANTESPALALVEQDASQEENRYFIVDEPEPVNDGTSTSTSQNEGVFYVCPAEGDFKNVIKSLAGIYNMNNCLFRKDFKESESKTCESQVEPEFVKAKDENEDKKPSKERENNIIFVNGYRYCGTIEHIESLLKSSNSKKEEQSTPLDDEFIPVYHVRFNTKTAKTIWAYHETKPYVEKNPNNQQTDSSIPISYSINNKEENTLKNLHEAYNKQNDSLNYLIPQFLIPKEDRPFYYWKKSTSHYINTAPLRNTLVPLMDLINERIRKLANFLDENKHLSVYTAAYNSKKSEESNDSHLDSAGELLVPDTWCKLVYLNIEDTNNGIVIYLHNTKSTPAESSCNKKINCDFKRWSEESKLSLNISDDIIEHAYCCSIDDEIMNRFGMLLEFSDNLNFNDLDQNGF